MLSRKWIVWLFSLFFLGLGSGYTAAQESHTQPHLLIKIIAPSGSDTAKVSTALDRYYRLLSKETPFRFIVSCDLHHSDLDVKQLKDYIAKNQYENIVFDVVDGKSIPSLYNEGLNENETWFDLALLVDINSEPTTQDYDKKILEAMSKNFADYDGVLNFYQGNVSVANQTAIVGKEFYRRFGYFYHPGYNTMRYQNELTMVSRILAKEALVDQPLIRATTPNSSSQINAQDDALYESRRKRHFDIAQKDIDALFPKDWSILICTITERADSYKKLKTELEKQIRENGLQDRIEILTFLDNRGEHTVGFKRNDLVRQSRGQYINFIDDDDDIHEEYIKMIHEKLLRKPDSVSLVGVITFNGNHPAKFFHSLKYKSYTQDALGYYRPPNHLNPMKRLVAAQFLFPMISYGEDTDWAMQVARSNLLQQEEEILVPYYFYKYIDK